MTATWTGAYRGQDGVMETFTGKFIDLNNPDPAQICIKDIAHHLALENRYCGATRWPVSVAQHSFMVREFGRLAWPRMSFQMQKQFLLHDAHEGFTKDLHRPMRYGCGSHERYEEICAKVQAAIFQRFELPEMTPEEHRLLKIADNAVCRMEAHNLMESRGKTWDWGDTPIWPVQFQPYDWQHAESLFEAAWESFDKPTHRLWFTDWPAIGELAAWHYVSHYAPTARAARTRPPNS